MKIAKIPKVECPDVDGTDHLAKPVRKCASTNGGSNGTNWSSHRVRHKSGPESYADLITRALKSNDQRRMTLAEIYDWLATNVPGLQEQRYLHSSKGWKNAVRHTLSINPRFRKITRVGRPGWWTLEIYVAQKSRTSPNSPTALQRLASAQECLELELEEFRPRSGTEPAYLLSNRTKSFSNNVKSPFLPISPSSPDTVFDFDYGRQIIKVLQDDGTVGVVTISKPVHLKSKTTEETGTQTEFMITEPQFDPDLPSLNLNEGYHSVNFGTILPMIPWTRSSEESTQNLLRNLPDDLRDITLDPTLNCDVLKIWSEITSDWLTN
jgi:forkhead box protein O3